MGEIYSMSKQIDFNDFIYYFKSKNITPITFIGFRGPWHIYGNIKNDNISIKEAEENKEQFKSNLNKITRGNPKID